MANTVPSQERVVDPFASYNSNVVNKITEIVTHNTEGMLTVNSLQVTQDSTSPNNTVVVGTGYAVKDDVLIKITSDHTVDITDLDNYVSTTLFFPGAGTYYVVLEYQYLKQRPAPQANIKILKPTERLPLGSNYLLLKVLDVDITGTILSISDYDTEVGYETNERQYIRYYAGGQVNLPIHDQDRDQGRIAYESARDKFFFGYSDEWGELTAGGVSFDVNTDTGVAVGELCYTDSTGNAALAISTGLYTQADFITTVIGTAASETGRGIICGYWSGVPVEPGILIGTGDVLFLSATTAGTVTNVRPDSFYQVVGRALSAGSVTTPIEMIFSPKLMIILSKTGQVSTWYGPDVTGYYSDVNVAALDGTSAFDCHWFDDSTNREVTPVAVEIRGGGNVVRIYLSDNTSVINYIIQSIGTGGSVGGGGGGSVVSDHALLTSLDFASSGHTGFAQNPHGNGSHSETYITAAGVTYPNLSANGDVGPAAGQVAIGDHTHESGDTYNYNDVPTGSIILFEADTAIVGYSLLADQDDMVVYITKGSVAGGEIGGTLKSGGTWTQPGHAHAIDLEASHTHTTADHTLTIDEMPSHTHTVDPYELYDDSGHTGQGPDDAYDADTTNETNATGGGQPHNHGDTGSEGDHDHGGATASSATVNTWRPRGRNLTRQRKI